ncbi:rhodanese-like domain-containing protein [Algirhabdus cladophorae]|uniref:rhodanese-like domain-containing protein n=1 Tax=Algirhabdus cladophorae TaxID=3377108 RepID=UPI003B8455C4
MIRVSAFTVCCGLASSLHADPVLEVIQDYADFAPYDAGIILPAQLTPDILDSIAFIDTRTADEFATDTIPGATNIEWRSIFSQLQDIPTDKKVVLFCNTGALSAQSAFGLRVLGYENVLLLQTGYLGWLAQRAEASQN